MLVSTGGQLSVTGHLAAHVSIFQSPVFLTHFPIHLSLLSLACLTFPLLGCPKMPCQFPQGIIWPLPFECLWGDIETRNCFFLSRPTCLSIYLSLYLTQSLKIPAARHILSCQTPCCFTWQPPEGTAFQRGDLVHLSHLSPPAWWQSCSALEGVVATND